MYKVIMALISLSSFAQMYTDTDLFDVTALERFQKIEKDFEESLFIGSYLSKFERSRMVECSGKASIRFPFVHNRLIYKATCSNKDMKIKLRLKVKYSDSVRTPYQILNTKITTTR